MRRSRVCVRVCLTADTAVAPVRVWLTVAKAVVHVLRGAARWWALLLGFQAVSLAGAMTPRYLEPVWAWRAPGRVEWFASGGREDRPRVLVATTDGALYVLDAATGQAVRSAPVIARPGVRPVGAGWTETVFCFDRQAVYAIDLSAHPRLSWSFGEPPAGKEELAGDPETLVGWVQAALILDGPVLVNRDGRIVWLDAADGRPRWELSLGRLSASVRLHVDGDSAMAAVLWVSAGHVNAALFPLREAVPTPRILDLGPDWPLWSAMTWDGLCAVWATRAALWTPDGAVHETLLDGPTARAAAVNVDARFDPVAKRGLRLWLLLGVGTRPVAYDLLTGRRVWGQADSGNSRLDIQTLSGNVATNGLGPFAFQADTGHILGACRRVPPARLLGWNLGRGGLYALYTTMGIYAPTLELVRVSLRPEEWGEHWHSAPPRSWTLTPTGYVSQVVWSDDRFITLEIDTLRAYTWP